MDCLKSCVKCEKKEKIPRKRPFPLIKLIAINANAFVIQVGAIIIFPFLPFMIHDFFPSLRRSELGQQAGFLGAAYLIGNVPGTAVFSLLSDFVGRKSVLLVTLLIGTGFMVLFGFSLNFAWALASRMLWGFADGNIGVIKALIAEVCDEQDLGGGFAIYGAAIALGRVTGSIIGGTLARPASKYAPFELPFFCDFPYLLPSLVGVALGLIAFVGGIIFIKSPSNKNATANISKSPTHANGLQSDTTPLLSSKSQINYVEPKKSVQEYVRRTKKIFLQFLSRKLGLATVIYTLVSHVVIISNELIPLLLVNSYRNGGYEMEDTEIGVILMVATVVYLPFQLIVFPWLLRSLGCRHTFQIGIICLFVYNILLPFSTVISGPIQASPNYNETYIILSEFCNDTSELSLVRPDSVTRITWNVWFWMIFINAVGIAGRSMMIGCVCIFISNASLPSTRGTINGLTTLVSTLGNTLGLLIGAPLFAWSENNGLPFPLDFHFVFNVNCIICLIEVILTLLLPKAIEHPRSEDEEL